MNRLRFRAIARWLPVAVGAALCGCFGQTGIPVAERSPVEMPAPESYVVQKDDTLYSIAWRHELDFLDIAEWNDLQPPYLIRPGDRIRLAPRRVAAATPVVPRTVVAPPIQRTVSRPDAVPAPAAKETADPPPEPGSTVTEPAAGEGASSAKPAAASPSSVPIPVAVPTPAAVATPDAKPAAKPASEAPPVVQKPPPKPVERPAAAKPPPVIPKTVGADAWRSPVGAKPVRGFGDGSKGLDYSLAPGTVIRAASSGVVVYAGPGLGGFRHLVIVKTSERHLVAYGVNVPPALREGDGVNQGDTVARAASGSTAGDFHFEIRDRGKPVDPRSLIRS